MGALEAPGHRDQAAAAHVLKVQVEDQHRRRRVLREVIISFLFLLSFLYPVRPFTLIASAISSPLLALPQLFSFYLYLKRKYLNRTDPC